jgi:hypothetical protein
MKKNKTMQVVPGDSNSTTAAGAGAEGGVVRDDFSEGELASIVGGGITQSPVTQRLSTNFYVWDASFTSTGSTISHLPTTLLLS